MRIIAGKYSAREIKAPKGHRTHPMSEKVRGALFNSLGDVSGLALLDAYAGSGAIAFEAISRGVKFAQLVEKDHQAFEACKANAETLAVGDNVKITRANVSSWSDNNEDEKFDLVICDPPYDKLNLTTVSKLTKHLNPNGLMVLSFTGRESVPTVNGVVVVDSRIYGDAALAFYRFR
jgi:16S rRNA (guanine966-N2)-methyltransferase